MISCATSSDAPSLGTIIVIDATLEFSSRTEIDFSSAGTGGGVRGER